MNSADSLIDKSCAINPLAQVESMLRDIIFEELINEDNWIPASPFTHEGELFFDKFKAAAGILNKLRPFLSPLGGVNGAQTLVRCQPSKDDNLASPAIIDQTSDWDPLPDSGGEEKKPLDL